MQDVNPKQIWHRKKSLKIDVRWPRRQNSCKTRSNTNLGKEAPPWSFPLSSAPWPSSAPGNEPFRNHPSKERPNCMSSAPHGTSGDWSSTSEVSSRDLGTSALSHCRWRKEPSESCEGWRWWRDKWRRQVSWPSLGVVHTMSGAECSAKTCAKKPSLPANVHARRARPPQQKEEKPLQVHKKKRNGALELAYQKVQQKNHRFTWEISDVPARRQGCLAVLLAVAFPHQTMFCEAHCVLLL